MPGAQELKRDVDRHQEWLEIHEERLRKVEITLAKLAGMMIAASVFGSTVGGGIVIIIQHVWK